MVFSILPLIPNLRNPSDEQGAKGTIKREPGLMGRGKTQKGGGTGVQAMTIGIFSAVFAGR